MTIKPTYEALEKRNKELEEKISKIIQTDNTLWERSENIFKSLFKQFPLGIEIYDAEGLQILVNHANEKLWNIKAEDSILHYNIKKDRLIEEKGLKQFVDRAYTGEAVVTPEFEYDPKEDGYSESRSRLLRTYLFPIINELNSVTHIIIIHEDITESEAIKKKLKKSERLHKEAQKIAKIGYWELDSSSKNLFFSDEIFLICGLNPTEDTLNLKSLKKIIHKEDWGRWKSSLEDLSSKDIPFDIEIRLLTSKGETRWVHVISSPKTTESVDSKRIFGTAQDITQQKEIEKRLRHAQKMESIGQLAGGIAHDFNNILYPIIGFAQLAKEQLPEEHLVNEHLTDILDCSQRAKELVKRILLLARKEEETCKPIRLKPVINEALKLIRASFPANITIQSDLYDGEACVFCNETQIREIVINLCTNSYNVLEDQDGFINVILDKGEPHKSLNLGEGDYIRLSISDNGPGIPENAIDKIFDPYYTTKKIGKGSGLGLSVVLGIVKSYNGDIHVKTTPGKGTAMTIFFPITDKQHKKEHSLKKDETLNGSETILFVDDEKVILRLVTSVFKGLGYNIVGTHDSHEALSLFKSDPKKYDLVITDMAMPKMIGTKLASEIKIIRPDVPIIICSGYSEKLDNEVSTNLTIEACIDKPIDVNLLVAKARDILNKQRG